MIMKKLMILPCILIAFLYSGKVFSQPLVGQVAPALTGLKMLNSDFPNVENKFVFVDFWATYCTPEVKSLDHLNALAKRFKDKIVFLAVSEENEEQVRDLLQGKQWYNIFFGLDNDRIFHKRFSIKDIPVYYLISPDNIIVATGISNEIEDYRLEAFVNKNDSIKQMPLP
jgi:thiol-disulfide isomerase/thioredoxin